MIKVLIVDDERLVRIGIRSSIAWEAHGFVVVGEACNGEDALEKIRLLKPDLMLTDIRMPKMDGIELLKKMEQQGIFVETVIMSCYNEFDLVRAAMKYGASDYLLKLSLSDDELLEVIERSKQRIEKRNAAQYPQSAIGEADLREHFTRLVLEQDIPAEKIGALLKKLYLPIDVQNMALILLCVDPVADKTHLSWTVPDGKTLTLLESLLHDDLLSQRQGDAFLIDKRSGCFLACLAPGQKTGTAVQTLQAKAKQFFNLTFSAAVMGYDFCHAHGFAHIRPALEFLLEARFLLGRGCVIDMAQDAPPLRHSAPPMPFLEKINGPADLEALKAEVRMLCSRMASDQYTRSACLASFLEIYYKTAGLLRIYSGSMDELNQRYALSLPGSLQQLSFLADAPKWFERYCDILSEYISDCENKWKHNEILRAINYINENYNLPISAQKVARIVGISEAYFSTLFKKETGSGFSEYLTTLRMNKAKQLLEDKNIYIYEVGEYVGYSDSNYFGKVFKKYTGMSPEAYRRSRLPNGKG